MTKKTKIAIVHDSLTEFGGAERMLFYLVKIFPQANIYTSLANKKIAHQLQKKTTGQIYFSKLSEFSLATKYPSFFKPYFYHYYWPKLNLDQYDLVISSSHSFCANWARVKNKHLSYIHTPPRFLYEEFNEMNWLRWPIIKGLLKPYFNFLRKRDWQNVQKIDLILSNSQNVKDRIKKYYDRDSQIIYPPIKIPTKTKKQVKSKKTHYLFFSRLVKQKGIELVIKTFNQNQKPLIVVGTGQQAQKWKKMAKDNIKFLGFVSDQKMPQIYAQSKALVYASIQEDFGMVPVEAMSHGLPVIAYQDGGVKETIIDQKTGLFFTDYKISALNKTILKYEQMKFYKKVCQQKARRFSTQIFEKKIKAIIKTLHD